MKLSNNRKPSTTLQKRAAYALSGLSQDSPNVFTVEWRKSSTWGRIAVICNHHGEKVAEASGCGYDKLSAVIADYLMWAPFISTEDSARIAGLGGTGYGNLQSVINESTGLDIKQLSSGKTSDTFQVSVTVQEAGK